MSYSDVVLRGMNKGMIVPVSSYKAYIAVASKMNIELVVENPIKKIKENLESTQEKFESVHEDVKKLYQAYHRTMIDLMFREGAPLKQIPIWFAN